MEQVFLNAWQKKSLWLWVLYPLTLLYRGVSWLNKKSYDLGLKKTFYPTVPVWVIGNITVGGSGKTPFIIALVQYLQAQGVQVGVISRGYGGDVSQMPSLVTPKSTPSQVGDEPCLIVQNTQATGQAMPMAVCPNRGQAIDLLLQHFPNIQLILADDGLQHHALDRDHNWIVVDGDRGFGNRQVLPTGFLREPIARLRQPNTTVIFHQKNWQLSDDLLPKNMLDSFRQNPLFMRLVEQNPIPLFENTQVKNHQNSLSNLKQESQSLPPQQVIAMTGIGYPKRFFNSLSKLGFDLIEKPLNDHHKFTLADFTDLPNDLPIIVTAKDAVKIRLLLQVDNGEFAEGLKLRIWVLPVVAELSETVYHALDNQLLELGIKSEL
ncbi:MULTISPECIES: tetraacyldisaccharide 4'-kinase [unclassified Moraxella]|uniref:tetraacyldisaccharide 4'-kinase n=1 Tax=unclassified Moraxella TaxID=2685852 RepID=UPI003AF5596C